MWKTYFEIKNKDISAKAKWMQKGVESYCRKKNSVPDVDALQRNNETVLSWNWLHTHLEWQKNKLQVLQNHQNKRYLNPIVHIKYTSGNRKEFRVYIYKYIYVYIYICIYINIYIYIRWPDDIAG